MKVKDYYQSITPHATTINMNASITEAVHAIRRDMVSRTVFVLNEKQCLAGAIPIRTLLCILGAKYYARDTLGMMHEVLGKTAGDIMLKSASVRLQDNLEEAFKKMIQSDMEDLPVVDEKGHVIGELNCFELIEAYVVKR